MKHVASLAFAFLFSLTALQPALAVDVREQYERDVDKVAAASQEQAISKLSALLKKYRKTRQEPVLLARLAELQQQHGAILFRIAHGNAHRGGGKLQLGAYQKAMKATIETLNALIGRYPDYEEMPLAYFMRAKAHEELDDKNAATRDYSHLVAKFPDAPETPPAYMALAEFAIAANDHARAISLLGHVESLPENPHYPFAIYKLAWSQFNLKNVPKALSYIERHLTYYREKFAQQSAEAVAQGLAASPDFALVENSLQDAVTFYFEGFEQGDSRYAASEAMNYFKGLEKGKSLGKMLLRFARLLRSHTHEKELIAWKNEVLAKEMNRPEAMDVVVSVYEFQQNRRQFEKLVESAKDMVRLYAAHSKKPEFAEPLKTAQRLLIETADALHALIQKNKGAEGVRALSASLASVYDAFTHIVEDSDPRVPRVHYNLAETLFLIGDFVGATDHYRWVVDHGKWEADPSLKAIAARHEVLKQKKMAGIEVVARSFSDDNDDDRDPLFSQWVEWLDDHVDRARKLDEKLKGDNFLFEANRSLYAMGAIRLATKRMRDFAERSPDSKFAIPSASLVLDTYLKTSDWRGLLELARDFQEVKAWAKSEFNARLKDVAADSYYKIIEGLYKDAKYEDVLKETERFAAEYKSSPRHIDCLSIAGKAALALGRGDIARGLFSRVIVQAPDSQNRADALLARALISEQKHELLLASADYRAYLATLTPASPKAVLSKAEALRRKTLFLAWLSGEAAELRSALESRAICTEEVADDCDRFRGLQALAASEKAATLEETSDALERVRKTSGDNRTVWAALALEGVKHLSFRDRLYLLRQVASGWEDADPLVKYALIPKLSVSIPKAFQANRLSMPQTAPLRAHERYITRRVEVIREMENAATKVIKLPWSRIRAEVLNEIAALYVDFSQELAKVPPPKDLPAAEVPVYEETIRKLVLPFEEKGQEMRAKAFEIASRFHIEEESFRAISTPYFNENPSQSKKYRALLEKKVPSAPVTVLDLELLDRLDESLDWRSLLRNPADEPDQGRRLRKQWAKAIQAKKWPQVAFFLQEAAQLKGEAAIPKAVLGLMKSLTLTAVGARGEGLTELDDARDQLDPRRKILATLLLVHLSVQTCSIDGVEGLLKQLPAEQLSTDEALYVAALATKS